MRGLDSYRDDIKAAEEMLKAAKEEYRKAALEKFERGELVEQRTSLWHHIFYNNENRFYCEKCNAIIPIRYSYCPCCGASMLNAQFVPRIREEIEEIQEPDKKISDDGKDCATMIGKLMDKGYSLSKMSELTGVSVSSLSRYKDGHIGSPRENLVVKIKELYEKEMM